MADYVFRRFSMKKRDGRLTRSQLDGTREAVDDFVNGLHPDAGDVQSFISEGPTSRDFYLWVRRGQRRRTYEMTWKTFSPDDVQNMLNNDEDGVIILGLDSARTQSVYYLRELDL